MKKYKVILSLGANLGNPIKTLKEAIQKIQQLPKVENVQISQFYQTSPVGNKNQPDFVNAVCLFFTDLEWREMWSYLVRIEKEMGKQAKLKNEPRIVDIDVLFYGDIELNNEEIQIPHPRWKERLFVLIPLNEFMEGIEVAGNYWRLSELIKDLKMEGSQSCTIIQ